MYSRRIAGGVSAAILALSAGPAGARVAQSHLVTDDYPAPADHRAPTPAPRAEGPQSRLLMAQADGDAPAAAPQADRPADPNAAAESYILGQQDARSSRGSRGLLSIRRPVRDPNAPAWSFIVGMGALARPDYVGADSYKVSAIPAVSISYRDWFFADPTSGVGVRWRPDQRLRLSAGADYAFGRDADDGPLLAGSEDLDGGVTAFTEAEIRPFTQGIGRAFSVGIGVETPLSGDIDGVEGAVDFAVSAPWGEGGYASVSVGAIWASGAMMDDLFGVTPAMNAASGLPLYTPEGGIRSYEAGITAVRSLGGRWSVLMTGGYERLVGDAADSPIVESRDQFRAAGAILYELGGD